MKFIKQYFGMKIEAITRLWGLMVETWEDKVYSASILMLLWTIFCTTFGLLLMPLDLLVAAITHWVRPDLYSEIMQDFHDVVSHDDFSDEEL
jgi:hypothetical protein